MTSLPDEVRQRALSAGPEGSDWLASLPDLVQVLAAKWQFTPGEILAGGTESLISQVALRDGRDAIVKIGFPGSCNCMHEARVLRLAAGRGYVELYDADEDTNALLLECLGGTLASAGLGLSERLQCLCDVMRGAWIDIEPPPGLMSGGEKSQWLAEFIQDTWEKQPASCSREAIALALAFCDERKDAHDNAHSFLVHGDAHDQNTLFDGRGELRLIDPDGLFAEPACDLAVPMREWSEELLSGDVRERGIDRCNRIAALTGAEPRAIWQWGFMERVSSGLSCLVIGLEPMGRDMLRVAEEFCAVSQWR